MEDKQPLAAWKNGQSQWDQKSVCTQKKPSWSHGWELPREGLGAKRLPLQRESALLLQHTEEFPHFPALPQLWDPMKFWFQKAKVHIPALLLWADPFPTENKPKALA